MSFKPLIISMLEESVEKLRNDLKPIEPLLVQHKEGMYITHDGENHIHVHCSLKFKAFIPKKYDGWPVIIFEWNPNDDLVLNLDFAVNMEGC